MCLVVCAKNEFSQSSPKQFRYLRKVEVYGVMELTGQRCNKHTIFCRKFRVLPPILLRVDTKLITDTILFSFRSSEEALTVLLKFLEFDARESIKQQLSTKFDLVMRQFIKEITAIEDKFTVSRFLSANSFAFMARNS